MNSHTIFHLFISQYSFIFALGFSFWHKGAATCHSSNIVCNLFDFARWIIRAKLLSIRYFEIFKWIFVSFKSRYCESKNFPNWPTVVSWSWIYSAYSRLNWDVFRLSSHCFSLEFEFVKYKHKALTKTISLYF